MSKAALKARLDRLLRGEVNKDDLFYLFFAVREFAKNSGVVAEIAHFLAHPEIRVKGLATDEARAVFTFLRFRAPLGDLDPKNIPLDLPAAAKLNLERSRSKTVKEAVGISRDKALDILESIIGRMVPNRRGGLEISQLLTGMDAKVFSYTMSVLTADPVFTDADLLADMAEILVRAGLMEKAQTPDLAKVLPALFLFSIVGMHRKAIDLADGTIAEVYTAPDNKYNLAMWMVAKTPTGVKSGEREVAIQLFSTSLSIDDYCELDIRPALRVRIWDNIEMTDKLTLRKLG